MVEKRVKKIRARPSTPSPFRAMPERNRFILYEVFPYWYLSKNITRLRFCIKQQIYIKVNKLRQQKIRNKTAEMFWNDPFAVSCIGCDKCHLCSVGIGAKKEVFLQGFRLQITLTITLPAPGRRLHWLPRPQNEPQNILRRSIHRFFPREPESMSYSKI